MSWKAPRLMAIATAALLATTLLAAGGQAATVNYGNFGTHPAVSDKDFTIQTQDLPATQIPFLARDDTASTATESDDYFYIHFSAATATASRDDDDIRLVVPSGGTGSAGDVMDDETGDYDEIVDLDGDSTAGDAGDAIDAFIHFLEMDGKPGFSAADWLYIDADDDNQLSEGDIRLSLPSTSSTSASGVSVTSTDRYVNLLDDDYAEAADTTEDNLPNGRAFDTTVTFDVRYHDADHDGRFDNGDTLVIVPSDSPSQSILGLGHVFLSTSGSRTHGNHVSSSESGTRPLFDALAATDAYLVTTSSTGDTWLYDLYIHFGSPDGEPAGTPDCNGGAVASAATGDLGYIQHGDVILRKGASGSAGSAASFMTRVTSESNGAGVEIKGCAPFAANVYYVNDPETSAVWGTGDFLYLNIPATGLGGTSNAVGGLEVNDLRLISMTFGSSFSAGTTVRTGNQDLVSLTGAAVNPGSAATPWRILHRDLDESRGVALTALSNAKFMDADADDLWDTATEEIYISSSTTVADGDTRIHAGDSGETGSTTATFTAVDCDGTAPDDADCGATIEANTDIKVTGPDSTWDEDQGEFVIWSPDAWATTGHDRAITPIGGLAAAALLTDAQTLTYAWSGSSDEFYLQWDEAAAPDGALAILKVQDVKWSSSPTLVSATDSSHVPTLHRLAAADNTFTRYDAGGDNPTENGHYLRLASAAGESLAVNDLRLTPTQFSTGGDAGKLLAGANTVELGTSALTDSASELEARVFFFDDGSAGLDVGDPVYLDLPADISGSADNDFSSFDVRLVSVTQDSKTYTPGSFVRIGDEDLSDFVDFTAWDANTGYRLYYFDENRDADFNSDDMLYLVYDGDTTTTEATVLADRLSIRMIGGGGSTGSSSGTGGGGSSGGGGGGTPTTNTATTSTATTATQTTTTTTGTEPITADTVVTLANANLAATLSVERRDGDNILTWEAQQGVAGYQVWVSTSPYTKVADIDDAGATTYTHVDGPASGAYMVTAWALDAGGQAVGKLENVNIADVQGNEDRSGVPIPADGDTSTGTGTATEPVPGLGMAVLVAAFAVALVAVRRRLS